MYKTAWKLLYVHVYREIFMEKHWRSVISRSVCDYFFEAQSKASSPSDIPPVIPTPHYYLITIFRNNLYFVAVLQNEGKYINNYANCIQYFMRLGVSNEQFPA